MIKRVKAAYPMPRHMRRRCAKWWIRIITCGGDHGGGGGVACGGAADITVLDRIGGAMVCRGMLYAILRGGAGEVDTVRLGQRALATTLVTDYAQPADEEQV